MDNFSYWLQIIITHEYYTHIPLLLVPTDETKHFMEKARIQWKPIEGGIALVRQNDELADQRWQLFTSDDVDNLCFNLCPLKDEFYYVSVWDALTPFGNGLSLIDGVLPNVWKTLNIPFQTVKDVVSNDIKLTIKTDSRYWEYILIPKYNSINLQLALQEEKNKVQFSTIEEMSFWGKQVLRSLTLQSIKMNEMNDCRIQLNEVRASGERLLSNYVPHPEPNECSPISPKDTITTYFYF